MPSAGLAEGIFQNIGLEPVQWQTGRRPVSGFRKLWAAVLEAAIQDLRGCGSGGLSQRKRVRVAVEASEWFRDPYCGPGSFRWVCAHLGLDAGQIRAALPAVPSWVYETLGNSRHKGDT